MTTIAILQPHFLPWLGYFDLINRVDSFVYLDDVQYISREWKNRNKIRKTPNSNEHSWLSVPVDGKATRKKIREVQVNKNQNWVNDHLQKIKNTYLNSPQFDFFFPIIKNWYQSVETIENLSLLNKHIINEVCKFIDVQTKFIDSTNLDAQGAKDQKLLNICLKLNAKTLIANNKTAEYANKEKFLEKNVNFITQDFTHPNYNQYNKNEKISFMPFLSIVDVCFNVPQNNIKSLLSN